MADSLVSLTDPTSVVVVQEETYVLVDVDVGIQGPPGPTGPEGPQGPAGMYNVTLSSTAPTSPALNDIWIQPV